MKMTAKLENISRILNLGSWILERWKAHNIRIWKSSHLLFMGCLTFGPLESRAEGKDLDTISLFGKLVCRIPPRFSILNPWTVNMMKYDHGYINATWQKGFCSFELLITCMRAKSLQSYLTLRDPMDCSPPGSSVHGILQARILEWVAMPSSRGSSQPRDQIYASYISCIARWILYHHCHLGSLLISWLWVNQKGDDSGKPSLIAWVLWSRKFSLVGCRRESQRD